MGSGTTVWVRLENGRTRTAGSSAVTVGSASETAVISSASAAARVSSVLGPGAAELHGVGADARQPGQQVGSCFVVAGAQSFEHEVGALDQPRRVVDGVDDDVGLTRHGLRVGLRGAVGELARRVRQDRHQFVGGAEHGL